MTTAVSPVADHLPDDELHCSFCAKSLDEVAKLIAGPTTYICDECISVCLDILDDEGERIIGWARVVDGVVSVHPGDLRPQALSARYVMQKRIVAVLAELALGAGLVALFEAGDDMALNIGDQQAPLGRRAWMAIRAALANPPATKEQGDA